MRLKALSRYRSSALFDLLISLAVIILALVNRDIYTYVTIAYFTYLMIESLREYLALHH